MKVVPVIARLAIAGLAACFVNGGAALGQSGRPDVKEAAAAGSWVLYAFPGTEKQITARWRLERTDGETLVIRIEAYLDGRLGPIRELKAARPLVPADHRRETIVAGGRRYDCQVFAQAGTTLWYSEDVPLLGIVRSQRGERDIMEIVDSSAAQRGR